MMIRFSSTIDQTEPQEAVIDAMAGGTVPERRGF